MARCYRGQDIKKMADEIDALVLLVDHPHELFTPEDLHSPLIHTQRLGKLQSAGFCNKFVSSNGSMWRIDRQQCLGFLSYCATLFHSLERFKT